MHASDSTAVRLSEYRAPSWRIRTVDMVFDLGVDQTLVRTQLTLSGTSGQPLCLDGEDLELLDITLDGAPLADDAWQRTDTGLTVDGVRDGSVLETVVRIKPAENTKLEGLYLSGAPENGFLLTQCEAEGFRRITYFLDRPDVLASYRVTLRAERARFPVLLAGGNPDGAGDLDDGRHWARFVDPHPRPSYLFALVAGHLEKITRPYTTADGREVTLSLWAEADAIGQCGYAMDALIRAMRWDEKTYGRNYDLDVFHVVATHDFNMGAMENKGLNIFNAKYLLADPDITTDDEYRLVEAVVAHEYFHNWSGNRVTCRDWFQLSLKEGLTVFREQSFSADMNSAPIKRIEDVSMLRSRQFTEDSGPLAHPVRPSEYREINNFYTATVYEKGAELVRMLAGRLGPQRFRKGMDLYFARFDGKAATIEDFLAALGEASDIDLSPYLAWYGQAGTPRLTAHGHFDAGTGRYTLELAQHTPTTPGQADKHPLPIPVRMALFDASGEMLALHMQDGDAVTEQVRVFSESRAQWTFHGLKSEPVPSLLRGFSAPVELDFDYAPADLALLLRADRSGYDRWAAGQRLAALAFDEQHAGNLDGECLHAWTGALDGLFHQPDMDPALLAALLTPPAEVELAERLPQDVDPDAVHRARQALVSALANRLGADRLLHRYDTLHDHGGTGQDAAAQAARRLKGVVLRILESLDADAARARARILFERAANMTDRLLAFQLLLRSPQRTMVAQAFRERHHAQALAMDKWFAAQAQVPGAATLERVQSLLEDPAFTLRNPNRVYALLGSFSRANPTGFHRRDGGGYALLTAQLAELDHLNPQVAARLATAFNDWARLEPVRRALAHDALAALTAGKGLSRDLSDILNRALGS